MSYFFSELVAVEETNRKKSEVTQSCPTLCNPMDCSLPGSSVHGILQARILEWVAISFSRVSSWPSDQSQVSRIASGSLLSEPPGKPWRDQIIIQRDQIFILRTFKKKKLKIEKKMFLIIGKNTQHKINHFSHF